MMKPANTLSYAVEPRQTLDLRGWLIAIGSGVAAGALIGSGSSGRLHWDRVAGPITAGALVALVATLSARSRPLLKALVADVAVVVACMWTITLRHWYTGHWPVGHIDGKWPFILVALLLWSCGPGAIVSLLTHVARRTAAAYLQQHGKDPNP